MQTQDSTPAATSTVKFSYFENEKDNRPRHVEFTRLDFERVFADARISPCTIATCGKGEHEHKRGGCKHKLGPAWSPARFRRGTRRAEKNVECVTALVLDLDKMTNAQYRETSAKLDASGYEFVTYSTHSDRDGRRCLRVILTLSRPVPGADWDRFWTAATATFDLPIDKSCRNPDRLYYFSSRPSDAGKGRHTGNVVNDHRVHRGHALDVDAILAMAPAAPVRAVVEHDAPDFERDEPAEPIEGALTLDSALAAWCPDATIFQHSPDERRATVECPNAAQHSDGNVEAMVFDRGGMLGFKCLHAHCVDWNWKKFRAAHDHDYLDLDTPDPVADAWWDRIRTRIAHTSPKNENSATVSPERLWAQELAQALHVVESILGKASSETSTPLFEPAIALMRRSFPETPWLVRGLIKRGGTTVVAGEPKTAKSWSLTEIAMAVATGTSAFGEFTVGVPENVAYFYCEDLGRDVKAHLGALACSRRMSVDQAVGRLFVEPRGRFLDITRDQDLALVVASCRRIIMAHGPLGLLCLEPLRDLHSAEEDSSDGMRDVMRRLRLLGEVLDCTIATVHHTAKASADSSKRRQGQRMRGSGAIHGSIDSGIYLSGLTGDGETEFKNTVQSEVKGARSAGHFALALKIVDGADGTSVRANWIVTRAVSAADTDRARDEADDAAVVGFVAQAAAQNDYYTQTELRKHTPKVPEKRCTAALGRLIDGGRLAITKTHPGTHDVLRFPIVKPVVAT